MKVTIIDYGLSNLLSVQHAFARFGAETLLTSDPAEVLRADALVLPGVGAFRDGMAGLEKLGLIESIRQKAAAGTPLLGICLGMQIMVIEFARNVLGYKDANSSEFTPDGAHNVISLMPDQQGNIPKGGTMRLGLSLIHI